MSDEDDQMLGIHDPARRSVRLNATIRPPDHLVNSDLADQIINALQAGGFGVDVVTTEELGAYDGAEIPDANVTINPHVPKLEG